MRIPISKIRVNPGRRDTKPRNVEELARSLKAVGLINPITVTQDNTLIAGLHRLEAAKLLGWTEIECTVSSAEGIQAELAEIDENFVRADLSHRELGDLLLRRKALYEALHPETQQGRRNGQTVKNDNSTGQPEGWYIAVAITTAGAACCWTAARRVFVRRASPIRLCAAGSVPPSSRWMPVCAPPCSPIHLSDSGGAGSAKSCLCRLNTTRFTVLFVLQTG